LSTHYFGNLRLRQASLLARLEQGIQKNRLVSLDTFNFSGYARAAHELSSTLLDWKAI
jgi:hypothetical protein